MTGTARAERRVRTGSANAASAGMSNWSRLPVFFPGARTYAIMVACLAVVLVAVIARPGNEEVLNEARALLEVLVPMPLFLISSGLLQADPALLSVAAKPVRLEQLLLARWVLAMTLTLAVPLALHVAVGVLEPTTGLHVLSWLAPTLFLSALAVAVAGLTASRGAGLGAAAMWWAASLFMLPTLQGVCAQSVGSPCGPALWSTAYGLLIPAGDGWVDSRVLLILAALVLAAVAVLAYRRSYRVFTSNSQGDAL